MAFFFFFLLPFPFFLKKEDMYIHDGKLAGNLVGATYLCVGHVEPYIHMGRRWEA